MIASAPVQNKPAGLTVVSEDANKKDKEKVQGTWCAVWNDQIFHHSYRFRKNDSHSIFTEENRGRDVSECKKIKKGIRPCFGGKRSHWEARSGLSGDSIAARCLSRL